MPCGLASTKNPHLHSDDLKCQRQTPREAWTEAAGDMNKHFGEKKKERNSEVAPSCPRSLPFSMSRTHSLSGTVFSLAGVAKETSGTLLSEMGKPGAYFGNNQSNPGGPLNCPVHPISCAVGASYSRTAIFIKDMAVLRRRHNAKSESKFMQFPVHDHRHVPYSCHADALKKLQSKRGSASMKSATTFGFRSLRYSLGHIGVILFSTSLSRVIRSSPSG